MTGWKSVRTLVVLLQLLVLCAAAGGAADSCAQLSWCSCESAHSMRCRPGSSDQLLNTTRTLSSAPVVRLLDLTLTETAHIPDQLFRNSSFTGLLLTGWSRPALPRQLLRGLESSLLALSLSKNGLEEIPGEVLANMSRLQHLDLSGNNIKRLKSLPRLPVLTELNLNENRITWVSVKSLSSVPGLLNLQMDDNLIRVQHIQQGAFSLAGKLAQLSLRRNRLNGSLDSELFNRLYTLRQLVLAENHIGRLKSRCFQQLTMLELLDLSGNTIDIIRQHAFSGLSRLKRLHLSTNHIVNLSDNVFDALSSLQFLDISNNFLESFSPDLLKNVDALQELRLDNNGIFYLDAAAFSTTSSLRTLDISGNPYLCDCGLQPLARWMSTETGRRLTEHNTTGRQATCATPTQLQNAPLSDVSEEMTCEYTYQGSHSGSRLPESDRIHLESVWLDAEGDSALFTWLVDPSLTPYRCRQLLLFSVQGRHLASVNLTCRSVPDVDPTRLQVALRSHTLHANATYRFCLALVEMAPTGRVRLEPGCSGATRPQSVTDTVGAVTALQAHRSAVDRTGQVSVQLRVRRRQRCQDRLRCVLDVAMRSDDERTTLVERVSCQTRQWHTTAAGLTASACVSRPYCADGTDAVRRLTADGGWTVDALGSRPVPVWGCVPIQAENGGREHSGGRAAVIAVSLALLLCLMLLLAVRRRHDWIMFCWRTRRGFLRAPTLLDQSIFEEDEQYADVAI